MGEVLLFWVSASFTQNVSTGPVISCEAAADHHPELLLGGVQNLDTNIYFGENQK